MLEGMIPYFKRALIVALFFGAFFAFTTSVFAQAFPPGSSADPFTPPFVNTGNNPGNPNAPGYFPGIGGGTGSVVSPGAGAGPGRAPAGPGGTVSETTNTPPGAEQVVEVSDGESCWSSPQGFFHCIATAFFGTFVAIAGYALDWSIELFITQFGQMYIDYGVGAVVEGTWGTVRDIFNLTFIFGLVYIGFQIILGINESGAKRTIPMLIVAALLVNFSLFIVKFIVDFSNLAALQIYNLFKVADTLNASGGQAKAGTIVDLLGGETSSISLAFINTIGVTSLLSHNPSAGAADGIPLFYTFGMIVVFLVLIYVFFAAAILITIRFAALTFYMIFSPIMFLGWVFPGMKQYSDKFWQGLFGQAFFAPALLFMLYISYQLSAGLAGPNRVDGSVFKNEANALGFAQFVPYLVLIVVFLMASLIVAKKMANQGASMVGKVNDWAVSKAGLAAGGMTAGLMARAGRNTIGAAAYGVQNSEGFKDFAARNGRFGKMMYSGVGKVADNSFDARKVGGAGKLMGVGEGRKGGMATITKENKESDEKFFKAVGTREWKKGKFEDSEEAIKLDTTITALTQGMVGVTDELQLNQMKRDLTQAKQALVDRKKVWETDESKYIYGRQLSYIDNLERWQKVYGVTGKAAGVASAGIIAGVATGGLGWVAAAGAGAAAGGITYATGKSTWYKSRNEAAALRKDYGTDGSKKKSKDSEEKKLKAALAAAGYKEPADDHGKKDKPKEDHGKKADSHHAPKAAPAPKAPSGGGGGGHDNHAHAGGH
jgi:outer membrane lipoprotein SlyB